MSVSANAGRITMSDRTSTASGYVLVEHLQVVTGVFLRRKGVHLAANRVDGLGDVFRRPAGGALEEHVLHEVGDAALFERLVPRSAGQPHADADGADVGHPLRQEPQPVRQHLTHDGWRRHRAFPAPAVRP
jgi:hypothetical protein